MARVANVRGGSLVFIVPSAGLRQWNVEIYVASADSRGVERVKCVFSPFWSNEENIFLSSIIIVAILSIFAFIDLNLVSPYEKWKIEKNFDQRNTLRRISLQSGVLQARPLFCAAQWDPEVSLVHSVARRSMVAAQQMRSGVSDSRFATRYESRAPTGEIVVDRSVNRAARHRSILNRPWNNLICLLLWECYVRIGGRFLSGPGCLLNSRSNKLDPIQASDFWISLFESDPPLDSFSLPLLRIKRFPLFSSSSWKLKRWLDYFSWLRMVKKLFFRGFLFLMETMGGDGEIVLMIRVAERIFNFRLNVLYDCTCFEYFTNVFVRQNIR